MVKVVINTTDFIGWNVNAQVENKLGSFTGPVIVPLNMDASIEEIEAYIIEEFGDEEKDG